jgi:hypothetical protein
MRARYFSVFTVVVTLAFLTATDVDAQKPSADAEKKANGGSPATPPGQQQKERKKAVTPDHAVEVTQLVLKEQGYLIVRVERVDGARVVYYRRGNNGRGRGKGPLEKMVIRPATDRVVIEAAPRSVLLQINLRLGL